MGMDVLRNVKTKGLARLDLCVEMEHRIGWQTQEEKIVMMEIVQEVTAVQTIVLLKDQRQKPISMRPVEMESSKTVRTVIQGIIPPKETDVLLLVFTKEQVSAQPQIH